MGGGCENAVKTYQILQGVIKTKIQKLREPEAFETSSELISVSESVSNISLEYDKSFNFHCHSRTVSVVLLLCLCIS